jgi:16S rRNA (guanine527-N7)-methyltransferase
MGSMTSEQRQRLEQFAHAVINAPSSLHLIAEGDKAHFWQRHIEDAMRIIDLLPKAGEPVLDLGSGNGVPGLVLAILQQDRQVTLLDSDTKKCGFLDMFCKSNAIGNVRVLCGRAETLAQTYRNAFPLIVARAFQKLVATLELAAPLAALRGELFVPHGTSWRSELARTAMAQAALGLHFIQANEYSVGSQDFVLLQFKKRHETPEKFPRRAGMANKRPL